MSRTKLWKKWGQGIQITQRAFNEITLPDSCGERRSRKKSCVKANIKVEQIVVLLKSKIKGSLQRYCSSFINCKFLRHEHNQLVRKIRDANQLNMELVKTIPQSLKQWWSRAVTVTLTDWLKVSTMK